MSAEKHNGHVAELEQPPRLPAEEVLLDILTLPDEVNAAANLEYDALMEQLIAAQRTDEQRQAVRNSVLVQRWVATGSADDTLPPELGLTDANEVIVRPELPKAYLDYAPSLHAVSERLSEQRYRSVTEHIDKVKDSLVSIMKHTLLYGFLRSFDSEPHDISQLPLNEYWRRVREAQTEQTVKKRYGVRSERPLTSYGNPDDPASIAAHYTLKREIARLDDETMARPANEQVSPSQKYLDWIFTKLRTKFESLDKFGIDNDGDVILYDVNGEYIDYLDLDSYKENCINGLDSYPHALFDNAHIEALSLVMMDELTKIVVSGNHNDSTFNENLELAIEVVAKLETDYFEDAGYADLWLLALRRPHGPVVDANGRWVPFELPITEIDNQAASVVSSEFVEELRNKTFGYAQRSAHSHYEPTRLIKSRSRTGQYAARPKSYDLVLRLEDTNQEPMVSGYELAGRDGNIWFFDKAEHDPDGDMSHVLLDDERVKELAEQYRQIGMIDLAHRLEYAHTMNIEKLQDYIERYTDYTYDEAFSMNDGVSSEPLTITDFKHLIRDGKLQAQCTGSALFASLSLELLDPDFKPLVVSGNAMRGDVDFSRYAQRITGVTHAMVEFTHGGKKYHMDTTGRSDGSSEGLATTYAVDFDTPKRIVEYKPDVPALNVSSIGEILKQESEHRRTQYPNQLRQIVAAAWGVSEESLLGEAVKLAEEDPVRMAVRLSMDKNYTDTTQVTKVADRLAAYASASDQNIAAARLPKHDRNLIESIKHLVNSLTA